MRSKVESQKSKASLFACRWGRSRRTVHRSASRGFTIVELLIATTIFSLVLLMAAAGIIEITRMYYRGTVQARTQEAARQIIDELAESVRYGVGDIQPPTFTPNTKIPETVVGANNDTGNFCIGTRQYTFAIDRQLVSSSPDPSNKEKQHVLWADNEGSCLATPADLSDPEPVPGGRELMGENMRLTRLQIIPLSSSVWRIELGVAYGDHRDLEEDAAGEYQTCIPGGRQSTFCAASDLSVVVTQRLSLPPPPGTPGGPALPGSGCPTASGSLSLSFNLSDIALADAGGVFRDAARRIDVLNTTNPKRLDDKWTNPDMDLAALAGEPRFRVADGCEYTVNYEVFCSVSSPARGGVWGSPPPLSECDALGDQPNETFRFSVYSARDSVNPDQCDRSGSSLLGYFDVYDLFPFPATSSNAFGSKSVELTANKGDIRCMEMVAGCEVNHTDPNLCPDPIKASSTYLHRIEWFERSM